MFEIRKYLTQNKNYQPIRQAISYPETIFLHKNIALLIQHPIFALLNARVAKLVNVAVSEAVGNCPLRVRVSPRAPSIKKSPGGEIGRRTTLRGWRLYGCVSSNLISDTKRKDAKAIFPFLF